jgi:hypothetical protein
MDEYRNETGRKAWNRALLVVVAGPGMLSSIGIIADISYIFVDVNTNHVV